MIKLKKAWKSIGLWLSNLVKTKKPTKENSGNQESQNFKIHQLEGLPFAIIQDKGKFFVVLGNNKINSTDFTSYDEAKAWIMAKNWEAILNSIMAINHQLSQQLNNSITPKNPEL